MSTRKVIELPRKHRSDIRSHLQYRGGSTARMPKGGNDLHVLRIIRGRKHARTKSEKICTMMHRGERDVMSVASCKHVNRPRPSSRDDIV